ncbi:MAG: secretin N-terminal domain-containing protein [Phycisphaerales bacterium]
MPPTAEASRIVRMYPIRHASTDVVAEIARDIASGGRERRSWEPADASAPRVRLDQRTRNLIVVGTEAQQQEIATLLASLDRAAGDAPQANQIVRIEFARASELAGVLRQFMKDRAATAGAGEPTATIVPSDSANALLLAGPEAEVSTMRDLVAQLDQPGTGGDRRIEIVALREGKADELARMLQQQFPRSGAGGGAGGGLGVIVTPDVRTNALVVNAPAGLFPQVKALIERLDAKPLGDVAVIRTYALKGARADEVTRLLSQTLQLDARGETEGAIVQLDEVGAAPVQVRARVVADRRSNSIVVTATPESFPVIEALIARIDDVPARSPVEYRIVRLQHAIADEVAFTLRQVVRGTAEEPAPRIDWNPGENQLVIGATADQFKQIQQILDQIDVPSDRRRQTDFVALKFAQAENIREALQYFYGPRAIDADTPGRQSVVIVADPAANSLVISADEGEWEGIRALVSKLDSEDYDASQQLRVFPLLHADATAVARAINEAFQGRFERRGAIDAARRGQAPGGPNEDPRQQRLPDVLVEGNEWVNAAPETQTNSVVVAASRTNLRKIEQIIERIDTPDYAKLPPPRLIPVVAGNPTQLAETLVRMFAPDPSDRGGAAGVGRGSRGLRIAGDVSTNTLLVRASDEEFAQVEALASALQQQADAQGLSVKIIPLKSAPAARLASSLRDAFAAKAKQQNLPLSIAVDAASNSLVVASTGPIFEEIRATVEQMDRLAPAAGQAIFVIDLQNISPDAAKNVIETIGLDKPQPENSISRIVTEPVKVSVMPGRQAIVVVASPGDRETIVALLKAIDSEPALAESQVRIVKLKNAEATALAAVLGQILTPGTQQSSTALAKAVAEQVRRLNVRRDGANEPDLGLDLTKPIRIVPDPSLNALVIASTEANVAALEQLAQTFDAVPVTDAVTVQIFPLENIAAEQLVRIVKDLFAQGKALATRPGARTQGKVELVPSGTVGKALLDSVAISIDERTNTVIVAGKEDAVALVEVLVKRLDTEVAAGWVEPRVMPLRFADAEELAATLQGILAENGGAPANSASASPLQKQVARLRLMRRNGGQLPDAGTPIESDYFQPLTRTVIRAEPHMNALLVVATPANIDVVSELVKLLDVEAASPAASVRIYPVQHASAAKLAALVTRIFDQQLSAKAIRPEDKVAAQADERTNALVVSTSPRSFAVLEQLLKSLDAPVAPDFKEIRTIEVQHASAQRLATMIQSLMDARLERLRKVQPETADLEKVLVLPDQRSNALVVAAGNDSFEVVQRLVADLDTEMAADSSLVQVIYLEKANADRIAAAVRSILDRRYADLPPGVRQSQRPLVLVDQRSNSLMIAAANDDFALISDLVRKLEQAPVNPAVGVNVVALPSGRAEQLAPRLEALMQQRRQSLGQTATPGDLVSIQADPGTNALIVAASDENLQVIRQLVQVLGDAQVEGAGQSVEVLALTSSRAADLVPVVQEMYVAEENRRRGPNSVRVAAEPRLNAVLVTGDPGDIEAVRALVARLDGAKPETVVEIKYIALASANALETVGLLENILGGRSIAGRGSRAATVLKYFRTATGAAGPNDIEGDQAGVETQVSTAIRESINLTPDARTNTIIVSAPRDSMAMIERMIRDLDSSTTGAQNIRVFRLTNADAQAMADILKTLFRLEQRGNLLVLKPREPQGGAGAAGGPAGGAGAPGDGGAGPAESGPAGLQGISGIELSAVPDERQQLSITIDSRTNSLLVSATPTYLDLVQKVVLELDAQVANERETNIYRLKNAVAAQVAQVVSKFVEEDQRKLIDTLGTDQLPSAARLLEREVTIVGDEKTNTVLINASPRYMSRVESIIRELDVDPPQVLIQVLLAEIALDATQETGVNLNVAAKIGAYTVGGGYGLANVLATSIGTPAVPFSDIPFVSVAGPDFNLLIKALQSQGRLQVLSNPSVMAANNEAADIQIGETVRLPESVSIAAGQQQSSVTPEDIGIILKVTPSINPDGFVRMKINPEISELSKQTTQISENFQSPVITRRRANTTVTVKDGETIVLGGLVSDRFERRTNKVPIIGDIPFLGFFFRSDIETVAKTELMIVLTPHVVMTPSQLEVQRVRELTTEQIERLALPEWLKSQLRKGQLEGLSGLYDAQGRPIESGVFDRPDPKSPEFKDLRGPKRPDTEFGDAP